MTEDADDELGWEQLANHVIAGRVRLGHRTRGSFASVVGINVRVLGDIEKARRKNYDRTTLAQVEHALGWSTGSVDAILAGGDPTPAAGLDQDAPAGSDAVVRQIRLILGSRYSAGTKVAMIEDVIARDYAPAEVDDPGDERQLGA